MANPNENVSIGIEIDVDKAKKDLDTLTKTIQELNESTDDNEELVKELEKQWDRLDKAIKDAGTGQKNLSKELKEVTKQLQVMKLNGQDNTEQYQKLIERAGQLKDAMGDTAQAINKTASDTANLDAILGAASAASGGFGLFTAGMSLLGKDTEDVEKAQKKLMQAITLVNSVQQISNALNKDSALMVKLNAVAHKLFAKQMQATATATNAASGAMKKFKAALVSTGIGALVVVLGAAVAKMIEFADKQAQTEESAERMANSYRQANVDLQNMTKSLEAQVNLYQKYGATMSSIEQLQFKIVELRKAQAENSVKETEAELRGLRLKKDLTEEDRKRMKELEAELVLRKQEAKEATKQYQIEQGIQKAREAYLNTNRETYAWNIEQNEKKIQQDQLDLQLLEDQNEQYKLQNNTEKDMAGFLESKTALQKDILENQKQIANENLALIDDEQYAYNKAIKEATALSEQEKKDLIDGRTKFFNDQRKQYNNEIKDLNDSITEIDRKAETERLKNAKIAAAATAEGLIQQKQAEVNAARAVAEQKKKIFEEYAADEGADLQKVLEYRDDYINSLKDLNGKESELLGMQQKQEEKNADGNAARLKAITENYANANKELLTSFTETMKGVNLTVQEAFMTKEAQIQETLDSISSEIDEINSKTRGLNAENAGIMNSQRNLGNLFKPAQDPEYVAEKKRIEAQKELYKNLYEGKAEYELAYKDLMESLGKEELALDQNYALQKQEAWKDAMTQIGGYVSTTLSSIADMQDKDSKRGFETAKKLQYASTVVNTLSAMMAAYRSLAEIPVVGTALAAAAMTATAATGAAQLAAIKRQKYGDENASISSTSSAGTSSASLRAGTSNVNTAILSRGIVTQQQPQTQYVAIVDEITYKQQQQTNIQKVSVV